MAEKPVLWLGSARADLRAFPEDARQAAGYQLSRVQHGEAPADWKPLPSIGPGVMELRIRTAVAHRVIYVAKFAEAVYGVARLREALPADPARGHGGGQETVERLTAAAPRCLGGIMTVKVERSSGNVFRDLGFAAEEAENLRLRSELMIQLSRVIKDRELTQARAAKLFGVSQPRISDLVRGKIHRFSVDTLIAMLGHAGVHVSLVVRRSRKVA
jgi:predicted XRE-type DNA-binding protein